MAAENKSTSYWTSLITERLDLYKPLNVSAQEGTNVQRYFNHSIIHSFNHSIIQSFTHSLTHSTLTPQERQRNKRVEEILLTSTNPSAVVQFKDQTTLSKQTQPLPTFQNSSKAITNFYSFLSNDYSSIHYFIPSSTPTSTSTSTPNDTNDYLKDQSIQTITYSF